MYKTKEKNIERIAGKLADQFEIKKRDNGNSLRFLGKTLWCQKRSKGFVHNWIQERVFSIHGDNMPNDYIYGAIVESLRAIEQDGIEDAILDSDCYYHQLLAWTQENFAHDYLDNVLKERCADTFFNLVAIAQNDWLEDILCKVKQEFFGA